MNANMNMFLLNDNSLFSSSWIKRTLILLIFLYPLLFIWQGGDLTDAGFMLIHSQNFFENLQSGQGVNNLIFFTLLIGATWLKLFPMLGVIGFKILYLLFLYTCTFITYKLLSRLTARKNLLLLGIFCGVVFGTRATNFVFGYDITSWLFLLSSGFFLTKGLNQSRLLFLYLAGLLLGLACLSRLPNIVFLSLLPIIITYHSSKEWRHFSFKNILLLLKPYSVFLFGTLSAFTFLLGILAFFNLEHTFPLNPAVLNQAQSSSSYSVGSLLMSYLREIWTFIPHAVAITSLMLTSGLIYNYSKNKERRWIFIAYIAILFFTSLLVYRGYGYSTSLKYLIPAFCVAPLSLSLFKKDRFSTTTVILLALALTQVAGTNTGLFYKLYYGIMALLPLTIIVIADKQVIKLDVTPVRAKAILPIAILSISLLSVLSRIGWIYHVDQGITCRLRATYSINHPLMKGILTTQQNASYIETLSTAININVGKEEALFIYGHQPLFYYLTNHPPPIIKFWLVNHVVRVDELFSLLNQKIESTGKWPVIVDTKQNIMKEEGKRRLAEFLDKHNYIKVVKAENFVIWRSLSK